MWGAVACSGGDDDSTETPSTSTEVIGGVEVSLVPATVPEYLAPELDPALRERVEAALASGGAFAGDHLGDADPASLAFYDYLWRNWGLEQLSGAREAAQAMPRPDEGEQALFLRLVHPDDPFPEVEPGDAFPPMLWALHCDQEPPPPEFADRIADQVREGGAYDLSHAAYAIVWAGEIGCLAPDLTDLSAAIVDELVRELNAATVVDHDSLLLSVGLSYLGRADLVPQEWLATVLDAQRDDGGWAQDAGGDESSWHTTGVALWTLAAAVGPGEGEPLLVVE